MTTQTLLNLNEMLDQTLDTVPEAPDFSNPPAGEYRFQVKDIKIDTYKNKNTQMDCQRLKILYSIVTTYSVAAGEMPIPDGSMFSETFQATEQGLGYFKTRIKAILDVSDLAGVSLGEMMNSVKGTSFNARISIKKTPNPTGGVYENIQIRVVPSVL